MKRISRTQKFISSGLNAEDYLKEFEAYQNRDRLLNLLNSKRIGYSKYSSNLETGYLLDIIGLGIPGNICVFYVGEKDWPDYFREEAYRKDLYFTFEYYPTKERALEKLERYLSEYIKINYENEDNTISLKSLEEFLDILSLLIFDFLEDREEYSL